ncbi:hypothetical protein VWV08_22345, partial [Xanthomonas citri pv. citri]
MNRSITSRPRLPSLARTGLLALACAMGLGASVAQAAEKITLQLKWVPQAQFAGYYVAQAKGYYK